MKNLYIGAFLILIIGAGVYLFSTGRIFRPANGEDATTPSVMEKTYASAQYGISFSYPPGYVLAEGEVGNGERGHFLISLVREEDSAPRENSEGPTAITLDIYQNDLDKETLLGWLEGNSASNFKLSDGAYASTTIAGEEAVSYRWSGLYEGETAAFLKGNTIVAVSVTYFTPQDAIVGDYHALLATLKLF